MKKQYFIYSVITCILVIFSVKAQNMPIDDLLKKFPTMEGVTSVSMSQQMLQSIFTPDVRGGIGAGTMPRSQSPAQVADPASATNETNDVRIIGYGTVPRSAQIYKPSLAFTDSLVMWAERSGSNTFFRQDMNVPEAYSSISISRTDIPANLSADLKKTLLSSKYEQYMEMNQENSIILGYYLKKVNDKCNEIVVLRQQKDQFSAIYIKGDIDINQVDRYLSRIRSALNNRMNATDIGIYQPNSHFAFTMPSFDDLKFPNFKEFDFKFEPDAFNFKMDDDLKLRMKESMKKMKDAFDDEDFQRKIKDSMEDVQRRIEDAQRQLGEKIKQIEEEQVESL